MSLPSTVRFDRCLSDEAEALLSPGSPLRMLVDHDWASESLDAESIDPQLREKNCVMLYHGTTRPLVAKLANGVQFSAHKRYGTLCGEPAKTLFETRKGPVAVEISERLRAYVPLAVRKIDGETARYYGPETEGRWQNRLALLWGRRWTEGVPWLVFDRESVLGFDDGTAKEAFYAPLAKPYIALKERLQRQDPGKWGKPRPTVGDGGQPTPGSKGGGHRPPSVANELDFLALDSDGQLTCIELKRSKNGSGIYWGPLQAALYRDAFQAALPHVRDSMQKLIRQKIRLGMLPVAAERALGDRALRSVTAALVVAEPNEGMSCWEYLAEVQGELTPEQRVPVYGVTGWTPEPTEIRSRP